LVARRGQTHGHTAKAGLAPSNATQCVVSLQKTPPAGTSAIVAVRSTMRVGVAGAAAVDLRTYPLPPTSSTNLASVVLETADGGSGAAQAIDPRPPP
jgi:hypothetical protein